MLVALVAFNFTACDNEPLEGQFVTAEEENPAEEGQFIATVAGASFTADIVGATYAPTANVISIRGIKSNGEVVLLTVANPEAGTFSLTATPATVNSGTYFPTNGDFYYSEGVNGGTGEMTITEFDQEAQTVTGTFSFLGVREQTDASGNPVLDGQGNPLYESSAISAGSFNTIPFEVDDTGGGGGDDPDPDPDPTDPEDSFFALFEGVEFEDMELVVNQYTVGAVDMLSVVATQANNATMRIDIPKNLGIGTHDFTVPISDGSNLIAIYNDGQGGENQTSESGSITITEYSEITGKLAATFNFEASNPFEDPAPEVFSITEGEFNVDFIPDSTGVENMFTADLDEVMFESTLLEVTEEFYSDEIDHIVITATNETDNRSMTLKFPKGIAVGSYEMSPEFVTGDEKVGIYTPEIGSGLIFSSNPGTLNITSYEISSGVLEGNFSFTAVDGGGVDPTIYEVTNGTFVITVQ